MIAEAPGDHLDFMQRLFKKSLVLKDGLDLLIRSKTMRYRVLSSTSILNWFPCIEALPVGKNIKGIGCSVLVDDLAAIKDIFSINNVAFKEEQNRIWLEPKTNFGALIQFSTNNP